MKCETLLDALGNYTLTVIYHSKRRTPSLERHSTYARAKTSAREWMTPHDGFCGIRNVICQHQEATVFRKKPAPQKVFNVWRDKTTNKLVWTEEV